MGWAPSTRSRSCLRYAAAESMLPAFLLLIVVQVSSAYANDVGTDLFLAIAPCPATLRTSPLSEVVDSWRGVSPFWSSLAAVGILLELLCVLAPFLCCLVGAGVSVYYLKQQLVRIYLGCAGVPAVGRMVDFTVQSRSDGKDGRRRWWYNVIVKYRRGDAAYRKQFGLEEMPHNSIAFDLMVSPRYPKVSRLKKGIPATGSISSHCALLGSLMLIIGALFVAAILTLGMVIEMIPTLCSWKGALWGGFAIVSSALLVRMVAVEAKEGAELLASFASSSADGVEEEAVGESADSPSYRRRHGYDSIPEVSVGDGRTAGPPIALPIAMPIMVSSSDGIVRVDDSVELLRSPVPLAEATPIRSIFGFRSHDCTNAELQSPESVTLLGL